MEQVKSYPELNMAAMQRRKDKPYRLWLLCRYLDADGRGWVTLDALRRLTAPMVTRQTLWRTLSQGEGAFWHKDCDRVYLRGLQAIADHFETYPSTNPVLVPLADFAKIAAFRAALVATLFAKKERTISHATLARLTGRTRRTIISYMKRARVRVTENRMLSKRPVTPYVDAELAEQGYYRTRINGHWHMVRRIPNSYDADFETAPHGMVKHLVKPSSTTQGALSRRYFTKPTAIARAVERITEGETILTVTALATDAGRRCWQGWTRQWGETCML